MTTQLNFITITTLHADLKQLISGCSRQLTLVACTFFVLASSPLFVKAQSFRGTGAMANDKHGHKAILLNTGKVLIIGGVESGFNYSGNCELYDPSTETWSSTGSTATARYFHTATLLASGKVLVTGGISTSSSFYNLNSCEIYDPTTGTWSSTGSMASGRVFHTATLLPSGKVLVTGGSYFYFNDILTTCELYDPSTGTWSNAGSMTNDRATHTATLLASGKVLVVGGVSNSNGVNTSELYDPSTDTWSSSSSLNIGRYNHVATLLASGKVMITGGVSTNYEYIDTCEIYDPSSGTWSNSSPMPSARSFHQATLLSSGKVLISGGGIIINFITLTIPNCELYDPSTDTWSNTGSLDTSRTEHQSILLPSGNVLVIGGTQISGSHTYLNSCELYTVVSCNGAGAPNGANVKTGNVTINTQAEMDAFYSTVAGSNLGKRFSKIVGNLTLNGNSSTDPITNFCNLSSLNEITGSLIITNFDKSGNPTNISQLEALTTLGCNLIITSNPQFTKVELANLATIGCAVTIKDNSNLKYIIIPLLQSVKGDRLVVQNHPKLERLLLSMLSTSFNFTGKGSSVDISNNGNSASGNLTMNLKKIKTIRGALVFNNNDNPGVNNFDNIFTGLTALQTSWGKLTITNNDYLGTCCIAASVTVSGTGKRHIISGNTGNCADSITVYNNCGSFNKRGNTPKGSFVTMEVYPNPSNGNFSLDITSEQAGMVSYTITDMLGRQVLNQTQQVSSNTTLNINMESTQAGQYIIKAQMNGQVFVKKIVVVK